MAANTPRLMILPGDGIGPEVTAEARRVVEWVCEHRGLDLRVQEGLIGYAAYAKHGTPMTDETMADAAASDAVLFGAQGGPEYEAVPIELRRTRGLLRLRKELDLFANVRPVKMFDGLAEHSSLKPEVVRGVDLIVLRELTAGTYFGEPRGIETLPDGTERGVNTTVYTTPEIERVARVAFELARGRRRKVTSVDKANVMEVGQLWRRTVRRVQEAEYPDVELGDMYADNCSMQLVRWPRQFDVIVTDNLFGDVLSDCAAMVAGSLGMLPSASLGGVDPETGKRRALYEPIHGSAPDIAGQGKANPLASILSAALMLRHSFGRDEDAALVEGAVDAALAAGKRTGDIAGGGPAVSTREMGDAVIAAMERAAR